MIDNMCGVINSVILVLLLWGSTETKPLEQNMTSMETVLVSLAHNVSALRRDMVSVEVFKLYLNQESAFRNTLQQKMDLLERNMTDLKTQNEKDQLTIQNLQNVKDALLYEVNILQQNMTDVLSQTNKVNNSIWTTISQRIDKMNLVIGGNISLVENKLEKYIETGMYTGQMF